MSGGVPCNCEEKTTPIRMPEDDNRHGRLWRVVDYKCNYSSFSGRDYTPSDYSAVICLRCGGSWRTRARYVETLQRLVKDEMYWLTGNASQVSLMMRYGRLPERPKEKT